MKQKLVFLEQYQVQPFTKRGKYLFLENKFYFMI